jgi:hypothetical protein
LIRHAGLLLPLTVGSLAVAMIGSALGRSLVSAVGRTALLPALQTTAGLAAVALAPVTGAADEKQRAAAFGPASTLPQNDNRIGHGSSPGGDWTTAQDRGRLQSACGGFRFVQSCHNRTSTALQVEVLPLPGLQTIHSRREKSTSPEITR